MFTYAVNTHIHLNEALEIGSCNNAHENMMHFKLVYIKLLGFIFLDLLIRDLFLKTKLSF